MIEPLTDIKKTIFNIDKLVKLPKKERELLGRIWNSPQCTGLTYLIKTGMGGLVRDLYLNPPIQLFSNAGQV